MKVTLKKVPYESALSFYDVEEMVSACDGNIIISGNRHFKEYGEEKLLDVVKQEYIDEEVGCDYEPLEMLEKVTGKKWGEQTIRGLTQREWQTLYYAVDEVSDEWMKTVEAYYFGEIDEFTLYYGDEDGFSERVLVPWYVSDKGKRAICEHVGVNPEETTVLIDNGYEKVYNYIELK